MSKDIFGNELYVGDEVAYITPRYHELKVGVITKVTPCGATIGKGLNRSGYQIAKGSN